MIRIHRAIALAVVVGLVVAGRGSAVRADGGQLRASEHLGPWRVSVFTSPATVGILDVSTLVEDTSTGRFADDVSLTIEARHRDRATTIRAKATTAAATNKLFQAAALELPEAGSWEITVTVTHGVDARHSLHFMVEVAEALARRSALAPWIAWPVVPIGLYSLHQYLACRQQRNRAGPAGLRQIAG